MIRGRVASPTFVGRVPERALLRAAHDAAPVFVLGAYRDDDVPGRHPPRGLLAELSRLSGPVRVATVELRRFDTGEARQQIEGILGSAALGYPRVRNYDGSWTEWGSLVGVPIER